MNVFSFTGNLGKECRGGTAGNTAVCNFSVAVKSGYGDREQSIWIDCALWGKRAEGGLPQYLTTGTKVAISGELGTREHEGKTYLTCKVDSLDLIGSNVKEPAPRQEPAASGAAASGGFDDDDIPFSNYQLRTLV